MFKKQMLFMMLVAGCVMSDASAGENNEQMEIPFFEAKSPKPEMLKSPKPEMLECHRKMWKYLSIKEISEAAEIRSLEEQGKKEAAKKMRVNCWNPEEARRGIPNTIQINGVFISNWLDDREMPKGNVNILKYGEFNNAKKLEDFNTKELRRCYRGYFIDDYHLRGNRADCDKEHLELVESLMQGKCVLCEKSDMLSDTTIVMNVPEGIMPQDVCKNLLLERDITDL